MPTCWLYTGSTNIEALNKANAAISIINAESQSQIGQDCIVYARELTAEPNIEGTTYYYMFQKPPVVFIGTASCDLETEFNTDWFIPEI